MDAVLRELVERVDAAQYAAAREHAWRTAAGTGGLRPVSADVADGVGAEALGAVAFDLADHTWTAPGLSDLERLALALALYRDLPSYAVLMWGTSAYRGFGREARTAFWASYRELLCDADDRLADPVAYSLWCDYFEDARTVDEAWRGLDPDTLPDRGLERLLDMSGPVPWALKERLYRRLVRKARWHPAIFRSLLYSRHDVYGQIDSAKALSLLDRLSLPSGAREAEMLPELRGRLEADGPRTG